MARYLSNTDEGRRITSVKLNGVEVLKTLFISAADTDEGWLDIYETETVNGKRCIKMSDWEPDPKNPGRSKRYPLTKRLHGKVEVVVGEAPKAE